MADDPKDLAGAAKRAEEQAAALAQKQRDAEAAAEAANITLCELLANGTMGKAVAEAAEADRAAQDRVGNARSLASAAQVGAKAARGKADGAALTARVAAHNGSLVAAVRALEATLRTVAERSATWDAEATAARGLGAELATHERRFKVVIPRPDTGAAALTPNLYHLASRVRGELEILDGLRHEAAHPTPPPACVRPVFLVAGNSPRARRQRQALRQNLSQRTVVRGPG